MAVSYPLDENMISPRLRNTVPDGLAEWLLGRLPETELARADSAKTDVRALQASFQNPAAFNFRSLWGHSNTACLQVHGLNDPAIQPPTNEQMNNLPEKSHAIGFEESAHFPMLEEGSRFNRLMVDFLTLASGESPRQLQLKEEWKRRVR